MLEFTEPYWLLLLLPVVVGLLFRQNNKYFIRKSAYRRGEASSGLSRFSPPRLFFAGALVAMVVALADPTLGFTTIVDKVPAHRIIIAVDNSSSMYNFSTDVPIYCTDDGLKQKYPRIYVGCRALHRFVKSVEEHTVRKNNETVNLIGIIRFALYSKVQSYPTSDYARLRMQIDEMNWVMRKDLGIYTEIHLAFWDMFLMALERNRNANTTPVHVSENDLSLLFHSLAPDKAVDIQSPLNRFYPPAELREKLAELKKELRDTVFVIFTDAHKGQLEGRLNKYPVSFQKLSELAALLELPVYIISTDESNAQYQQLMQKTGFGHNGSPTRGDFLTVKQGGGVNLDSVDTLVSGILAARFGMTVSVPVERRISYAMYAVLLALTLILCGVVWKETLSRSLTEI